MNMLPPQIIQSSTLLSTEFPLLDQKEQTFLTEAAGLFEGEYYSYSLIAVWNAAVHNLRRKIETYGAELWTSAVSDEKGRKKYNLDGETIAERWCTVDDLILIKGATKLGLLSKKSGKSLEMINWMRNHSSAAHDSDNRVTQADVISLVFLLQENLFGQGLPNPGYSISDLFEPVKGKLMNEDEIEILSDQIRTFRKSEVRTTFGFFSEQIIIGKEPAYNNAKRLFPALWELANEDLKKDLGLKYHKLSIGQDPIGSEDKGAMTRVFEILVMVEGVGYIPPGAKVKIYKRAAEKMRIAKDTSYGWSDEYFAALNLAQMGTDVPKDAFEEVYQEIIAIWCGNFWGRSEAHEILQPFINNLSSDKIRKISKMFRQNDRVQAELFQDKPKYQALNLLKSFRNKLTIEAHKQELHKALKHVKKL